MRGSGSNQELGIYERLLAACLVEAIRIGNSDEKSPAKILRRYESMWGEVGQLPNLPALLDWIGSQVDLFAGSTAANELLAELRLRSHDCSFGYPEEVIEKLQRKLEVLGDNLATAI